MDKKEIIKIISENRPSLAPASIKTYYSIISNLMRKLNTEEPDFFIKSYDKVLEQLQDEAPRKRKTILSAVIVFSEKIKDSEEALKKYRDKMNTDADTAKAEIFKNQKTEKQLKNWLSFDEIKKIYEKLEKSVSHIWNMENIDMYNLQKLQQYIILSLYVLIAPRRLLDFIEMKMKNYNKNDDNYVDKNELVFNIYKSAKFYGRQVVEMPDKLLKIINKWKKLNPSDYMLVDNNFQKMSQPQLTQRLNKIFDKKISASMLRHIFISTEVLPENIDLGKMNKISEEMGHSLIEQLKYKKN